jgi:hypothetical protein
MMMTYNDDLEIAAWTTVIEDLLSLIDMDKRSAVLAAAVRQEAEEHQKRVENGSFLRADLLELNKMFSKAAARHSRKVMRLRSLVAFVRTIINSHSSEQAARILFADPYARRGCTAGGLADYLDGLPGITVDIQRAYELMGEVE